MTLIIDLSHNLALLFSLTFLYGLLESRLSPMSTHNRPLIVGLLFGAFGIVSMTLPVPIAEGMTFTGRSLMIGIAGLFGGPIPALIAALMVTLVRSLIGESGLLTAGGSALVAALVSIGLWRWSRGHLTSRVLIGLGLLLAVNNLLWSSLGKNIRLEAELAALLVTIWLFPLATWVLGKLLLWQHQRQETECALRESEQRFRAIFNSTFQFTGLLKPDGTLIEVNQTALVVGGLTPEQVIGRPFWETYWWSRSLETQQRLRQAVEQAARGEFVRYEAEMRGQGDQIITIDFSLKPLRDSGGSVVLLIPEGRDISERKLLEAHQREVEHEQARLDLLRTFIHNVSHDFRTPLTVISTNIYLLNRIDDREQKVKRLEIMQKQIERVTTMLDDMFIVTKLELNTAAKTARPVALNLVMGELVEAAQPAADRKQVTLTLTQAEAPSIMGDEPLLTRAIKNLLDNALLYTPEGGRIDLSTQVRDDAILIEVCDTGVGIAPEDQPFIYDLFYRVDRARSIETGGSGLGLYMTRKIVEIHGGSVEVDSAPNQGSKFRVRLPLTTRKSG